MSASTKFRHLLVINVDTSPTPEPRRVRYTGRSFPKWTGLIGIVTGAYSFDGDMWCYEVDLEDGTHETWMDCEVEAVFQ